jgi:chaperonin GroES
MATKLQKLIATTKETNIAKRLDTDELTKIGQDVVKLAKEDDGSRADWLKKSKKAMDHALQVVEEKTFPWPNASNVKYPLLTVAALQFHGRIYPEIVQGNNIVKARVTGRDETGEKEAKAERVADHMNYQLLEEMPEWDEQTDKLLLALPIEGCEFKKSYYDPTLGRNVSVWVRPEDLIVHNDTKILETSPRITHRVWFKPREIKEKVMADLWLDEDLDISVDDDDKETSQEFYEQHTFLDLDDDGYKEPYIITVHVGSEKVVRLKAGYYPEDITVRKGAESVKLSEALDAGITLETIEKSPGFKLVRIDRFAHFQKFAFIPSPDGSFYDIGFGQLIGPLNDSVDTIINQLIDKGTLNNLGGGFVRSGISPSKKRSPVSFTMGEYKQVDIAVGANLRDSIMAIPQSEPSMVLFNMLGTLIQGVKDITSVQDIFTGGQQSSETATTTLARIEQGLKVFSAIFKRVYRSLGKEIQTLYRLNAIFLEPETYFRILDDASEGVVTLSDYRNDGTDVQPVADPSIATNTQRVARAQLLMQMQGNPLLNAEEITRRFLVAIEEPNIDALIIPEDQRQAPPPDPKQIEMQIKLIESQVQTAKTQEEMSKIKADTIYTYSKAVEAIANAESKEAGNQLALYRTQLEGIIRQTEVFNAGMGEAAANQGVPEPLGAEAAGSLAGPEPIGGPGVVGGPSSDVGMLPPGQV